MADGYTILQRDLGLIGLFERGDDKYKLPAEEKVLK